MALRADRLLLRFVIVAFYQHNRFVLSEIRAAAPALFAAG
jgi:hypothetical protein